MCQCEPRLHYHSYGRECRNRARRDAWRRMPAWRKQQLYSERKKALR
jgi:hypothetical protein